MAAADSGFQVQNERPTFFTPRNYPHQTTFANSLEVTAKRTNIFLLVVIRCLSVVTLITQWWLYTITNENFLVIS